MAMAAAEYELWDLEAGNCIGAYPDEQTALAEVRAGVREDGREVWSQIGLLWAGEHPEDVRRIAEGEALLARALVPPHVAGSDDAGVAEVSALISPIGARK